jgi:hypothetical protein
MYAELAAQRGLLLSLRGACGDDEPAAPAPAVAGGVAAGGSDGGGAAPAPPAEVRVHPRLGGTMHYL